MAFCPSITSHLIGWDNIPIYVRPNASVSTLISFKESKCIRKGTEVKASLSLLKASYYSFPHVKGGASWPFFLFLVRLVKGLAIAKNLATNH
jgi:hypothetical protein